MLHLWQKKTGERIMAEEFQRRIERLKRVFKKLGYKFWNYQEDFIGGGGRRFYYFKDRDYKICVSIQPMEKGEKAEIEEALKRREK